jgi:hypothetical protein
MSNAEDQAMEMEALDAIFMQDLTMISSDPTYKFTLHLVPHSDQSQTNHGLKFFCFLKMGLLRFFLVGVVIEFELPEEYPQVIPIFKIKGEKDLDPADIPNLNKIAKDEVCFFKRFFN